MARGMEIIDRDYGWAEMVRSIAPAPATPAQVVVGWPARTSAEPHGGSTMSIASIAATHEYGTSKIPQRSMLGATIDENAAKYQKAMRQIGVGITRGRIDLRRGLDLLGIMVKGDVQARIAAGIGPPLAPATIKAKGSSKPLIDTGQMRQALDHEVRGG